MDNYLIYKIVFPNGKHYIGLSTRTLDERKKEHRYNASVDKPKQIVHKALKKFDMIDTFELILIDDSAKSIDELYEKEIFYIQKYDSYYKNKKGYNMTLGGEGNHGYVYTKADRKKMSQTTIEQFSKPEAREQISQKLIEYHKNNPEAREQMSQRAIKQFSNPESRQKATKGALQRFSNPEQREKARERAIEYHKNNPEAGKVHGEKIKALYKNNPEVGKVHGERIKEHYENNPEAREQMSQIKKEHYKNNPEARKCEKNRKLFKVFRKHNMEFMKEFEFQFEAIEYIQEEFNINVSPSLISECLYKKRKSTRGFVFEYV